MHLFIITRVSKSDIIFKNKNLFLHSTEFTTENKQNNLIFSINAKLHNNLHTNFTPASNNLYLPQNYFPICFVFPYLFLISLFVSFLTPLFLFLYPFVFILVSLPLFPLVPARPFGDCVSVYLRWVAVGVAIWRTHFHLSTLASSRRSYLGVPSPFGCVERPWA